MDGETIGIIVIVSILLIVIIMSIMYVVRFRIQEYRRRLSRTENSRAIPLRPRVEAFSGRGGSNVTPAPGVLTVLEYPGNDGRFVNRTALGEQIDDEFVGLLVSQGKSNQHLAGDLREDGRSSFSSAGGDGRSSFSSSGDDGRTTFMDFTNNRFLTGSSEIFR